MKKDKILIIGASLCFLFALVVGYAVFQTNLTINGTSSISSNWQVEITGVISKNIVGSASNESEPVYSTTAVTFKTLLESPGDSIDYEVTITNNGSLSAKLNGINKTNANNPAIVYTISGINEGDILAPGESKNVLVTVAYSSSVTTQPDNLISSLTVDFDFVQA